MLQFVGGNRINQCTLLQQYLANIRMSPPSSSSSQNATDAPRIESCKFSRISSFGILVTDCAPQKPLSWSKLLPVHLPDRVHCPGMFALRLHGGKNGSLHVGDVENSPDLRPSIMGKVEPRARIAHGHAFHTHCNLPGRMM
jgi:hypothetical protein